MNHYTITLGTLDKLGDTLSDYQNAVQSEARERAASISNAVAQTVKLALDIVDTTEIDITEGKESLYLHGFDLSEDGVPCKLRVGRILDYSCRAMTGSDNQISLMSHDHFDEVMNHVAELLPVALKRRYPEGNVTCAGVEMTTPVGDVRFKYVQIFIKLPASAQKTVAAAIEAVQPKKVAKIETPSKASKRQPIKTPKAAKRRSKKAARA